MTTASYPIIGTIATMPSRINSFGIVLDRVLPQLDRLYVFLDGFTSIPEILKNNKNIYPVIIPREHTLFGANRFLVTELLVAEAIIICFDDDIFYPDNYVKILHENLKRFSYKAIIGVHGNIYFPPFRSYIKNRHLIHFSSGLRNPQMVNTLGCGTVAYLSSVLTFDPGNWKYPMRGDLSLAFEAAKARVPMLCLPREPKWLMPIEEDQPDSLWRSVQHDERLSTSLMREVVRLQILAKPVAFLGTFIRYWVSRKIRTVITPIIRFISG